MIFLSAVELEGLEGDRFEAPQYEALLALLPAIAQRYGLTAVVGHEHIAPGRKADPGAGMDWSLLQTASGLAPQCFPHGAGQQKSKFKRTF